MRFFRPERLGSITGSIESRPPSDVLGGVSDRCAYRGNLPMIPLFSEFPNNNRANFSQKYVILLQLRRAALTLKFMMETTRG